MNGVCLVGARETVHWRGRVPRDLVSDSFALHDVIVKIGRLEGTLKGSFSAEKERCLRRVVYRNDNVMLKIVYVYIVFFSTKYNARLRTLNCVLNRFSFLSIFGVRRVLSSYVHHTRILLFYCVAFIARYDAMSARIEGEERI